MFSNPFSPVFGGRPTVFFGRADLRRSFRLALIDPSSEDRALFITGTRGSGKTTLVELFSGMASDAGWKTVDLGPDHTVRSMLRELTTYDEKTTAVNPQVSLSVLGSGGSVAGISTSKTRRLDEADLTAVLLEACKEHPKGIFVSIDEIQKVSESDVSTICNAFQLALRKGHNVILVLAGLPYAHETIIRYEGCTFMRRARHVELTLLSREETLKALDDALRTRTNGLVIDDSELERLVEASYGHPYMLQLLGYYLVVTINAAEPKRTHNVSPDETSEAIDLAQDAYKTRALRPLVAELKPDELRYLQALASVLDNNRMGTTSKVTAAIEVDAGKASYLRKSLIDHGIIISAGYGKLMFNIPYLASHLQDEESAGSQLARVREWQL